MRKIISALFFIVFSLTLTGLAADPAWSFKCQSGTIGQGNCSCSGTADCTDMRHSKMCKGDLNCGAGKCSCTAALISDPGSTGGKPKVVSPKATTNKAVKQ